MTKTATERIRCPFCDALVPVPTGREHWHAATRGWISPTDPLACPHCSTTIAAVDLTWLVTVKMRIDQLAANGIVLCYQRSQLPTHEDLDAVVTFQCQLQSRRNPELAGQ